MKKHDGSTNSKVIPWAELMSPMWSWKQGNLDEKFGDLQVIAYNVVVYIIFVFWCCVCAMILY